MRPSSLRPAPEATRVLALVYVRQRGLASCPVLPGRPARSIGRGRRTSICAAPVLTRSSRCMASTPHGLDPRRPGIRIRLLCPVPAMFWTMVTDADGRWHLNLNNWYVPALLARLFLLAALLETTTRNSSQRNSMLSSCELSAVQYTK
ncbi:hypothetical protein SEVIR_2G407650v4 [Setaria viridis]